MGRLECECPVPAIKSNDTKTETPSDNTPRWKEATVPIRTAVSETPGEAATDGRTDP